MTKWGLYQVCKVGSTFENKLMHSGYQQAKKKKKKLHAYINRCRKSI